MGISTDAILFYGIDLGEDEYECLEDEWEKYYVNKIGVYHEHGDNCIQARYEFWNKKRDAVRKSECTIGTYCSYDDPMHYVALKKTHVQVWRGYVKVIKDLHVPPGTDARIREFCELMGIKYEQPKWMMVSLWG
jgi:hypothetical protein